MKTTRMIILEVHFVTVKEPGKKRKWNWDGGGWWKKPGDNDRLHTDKAIESRIIERYDTKK